MILFALFLLLFMLIKYDGKNEILLRIAYIMQGDYFYVRKGLMMVIWSFKNIVRRNLTVSNCSFPRHSDNLAWILQLL